MSHRSVSQGNDIFEDGNIEGAVSKFKKQHSCNKYCEWPGFHLHTFKKQNNSERQNDDIITL